MMDTAELLKKVRRIEIKTKGLTNQVLTGSYHSAFKGRGMSFSEVREYQFGDDVRNIEWNVTARYNHPYVKVFEEERELSVMLLIDVSPSSLFGSIDQLKSELIAELSAILAFSAITNNDKVGVIFFSDQVELFIPPKKGRSHILRIIREILNFKPEGKRTDLSVALRYFNNIVKKRSVAFVLSDFMDTTFSDALSIAKRRHDLVGIRIYDPLEADLPNLGLIRVSDLETGNLIWLDTARNKVRQSHNRWYDQNVKETTHQFRKAGADLIHVHTGESYIKKLISLFALREKRQ